MRATRENLGRFFAEKYFPIQTTLVFFTCFLVFLLAELICPILAFSATGALKAIRIATANARSALPAAALFLLAFAVTHCASRQPDILWSNSTYLLMTSDEADAISLPGAALIASAFSPICLLSFVMLGIAVNTRSRLPALLLFASSAWFFAFALAGCSRLAAVALIAYGATRYLTAKRRRAIRLLIPTLIAVFVLQAALIGRNNGTFGASASS